MSTSGSMQDRLNQLRGRPEDDQVLAALRELVADGLSREQRQMLGRVREELSQAGDWQAVVGLIDVELPHVGQDEQVELLSKKGRVLEDELLLEEEAVEAFKAVLELCPDDEDVLDEVEQIEMLRDNWERVAAKFVDEANGATDKQLASESFLSAAEVIWRNGGDLERVEELLRRSLDISPTNLRASGRLERLLLESGKQAEAVAVVEGRAEHATTSQQRVAALFAAARLHSSAIAENPSRSIEAARCLCAVLEVEPRNSLAIRRLLELPAEPGAWGELAAEIGPVLQSLGQEQDVATLVEFGRLLAERVGDTQRAEPLFRRVRKVDPTEQTMLDFYRRHYAESEEPAKMLTLLDAAQRAERDPDQRIQIAREMAAVAEQGLQSPEKAIDIWKGILRIDSANADASIALKRLYRGATPPKWNALRELLKDEIDALSDEDVDEKIALLQEVVEIYSEHLKLDVMVINTYSAILDLRPDHVEALEALKGRYESMGRWNDLIGLLNKRKDFIDDDVDKIAVLRKIASIWLDRFGNPTQATQPLSEILEIDPLDNEALVQLKDIYQRRRNWHALLGLLRHEAEHRTLEERRALTREMAAVAATRLGDPGEAIQVWNTLLKHDARDAEALDALTELYRRQERWAALAEVLNRKRENAEDDEQAVALLEQLGDIYTNRLRGPDNAIAAWRAVLKLRRDHPKATNLLRELYVQQQRWDDLEQLFGERDQWTALAETLSAAADRAVSDELRVKLHTRVGEICADQLDNAERAIKAYERVLAVDSSILSVCEALVPLYRQTERWSRLLTAYEMLLDGAVEVEGQLGLLDAIRDLCETHLGSRQLAFQWWTRAYRLAPDDESIVAELKRLAAESEAWDDLVAVFGERVEEVAEPSGQQSLLREMARICEEQLHRPEDGEAYHRQLLAIDPTDSEALFALEQLYSARQRWVDLVGIYRQQADNCGDDQEAMLERLFKIAFVQEERIGDPLLAIESYRRISELAPRELRAIRSLERLYLVRGEWAALVGVYRQLLSLLEDEAERVDTLRKLGELLYDELDDRDGAIDALLRALEQDPNHRPTILLLEQHLEADGDHRPRIAGALEPVYERAGDYSRLVGVLEVLLDAEDEGTSQRTRLRRVQHLCERRTDEPLRALAAAERLFALDASDGEARRDLTRLAEATDNHERLGVALRAALASTGANVDLELTLRWELALLLDGPLADADGAEEHARRVVELDSEHRDAFLMLERILRDKGSWEELRDVLHRRRELAQDSEEQRDIWEQICALNEDVLGDEVGAITAYEEMLKLRSDDPQSVRSLERHYREAEMWVELADFYAARVRHATSDGAIDDLRVRQAEVRARELADIPGALDLLEEVVASNPEHEEALGLLEFLLTEDDEQQRITGILEALYQRTERWTDVVSTLLVRKDLSEDPFEQVELLTRIAKIQQDELGDSQGAFFRFREALRMSPGTQHLQDSVKALAEELELWEAAAEAWRAALQGADQDDLPLRAVLMTELAEVLDSRLDQREEAISCYEALVELDPDDIELGKRATHALLRLYEMAQRWDALVTTLRRRLLWTDDAIEHQQLLSRIGRIQEDLLDDFEAATVSYRELLEVNGESSVALDALERLFLASEDWEELIKILRRRVELAVTPAERVQLWRRIADLYETELGDVDQTIVTHLALIDDAPDDLESLRALSRLYREGERWADLLDVLERRLSLNEGDGAGALDLIFEASDVQHHRLDDLGGAIARYREILELDPRHEGTRKALEGLLEHPEERQTVCGILAPIYRIEEQWEPLISVLQLQSEEAAGTDRIELLREIGEIYEERLKQLEPAFAIYREAIETAVEEPELPDVVNTMGRVAVALGAWNEFVEALERCVDRIPDPQHRRDVHRLAADACRQELGDLSRAEIHYRALRALDDSDLGALEALETIYLQKEDWERLLEVLLRRAELCGDEDLQAELLGRAAIITRDELRKYEDAIGLFERVIQLIPEQRESLEALDALYSREGRWQDLAQLLAKRVERGEEIDQQTTMLFRLAQVRAERLGEHALAMESLSALITLVPNHSGCIAALEGYLEDEALALEAGALLEPIYAGRQQWNELVRIHEIRLDASDDLRERHGLMTRIAQLFEEQLEDFEGAFGWYGKVFLEEPMDRSNREQLLRLASLLDGWDKLTEVFEQYLGDVLTEDETSREIALLTGRIYDDRLYTWEPAKVAFERVLNSNPADEEAFRALEQLLMRHERWEELLGIYQQTVDATLDATRRKDLMFKTARVWEEALEDVDSAIDAYAQIFEEESDLAAATALERLYRVAERWQDLCELITRRMDFVEDGEQLIEMKCRLGEINEKRLGEFSTAIDHYEDVLKRDSAHPEAIAALERLVMDRDQRFRIAQILEEVYREQDEWAKLVVIYDAQLAFVEDRERRSTLLREIARLHESRGGSLELAFSALCQALEQDPEDQDLLGEVERVAEMVSGWSDVVKVLRRCADGTYDYELQSRLFGRLAELLEERLGDGAAAVEAWRKVLAVKEGDLNATEELVRLLEEQERWEELVEALRSSAELSSDPERQQNAYWRVAQVHMAELPQDEKAIEACRQVLGLEPGNAEALDAMESLYRRTENWIELIWVFQQKIEQTTEVSLRRELQLLIAATHEERLEDNFEAISVYKLLLSQDPQDELVLDALDRLYSRECLWTDLLEIVDLKLASVEEDRDAISALRYRAGAILSNELGEHERAVERFEEVLQADASHAAAREALEGLITDAAHRDRVARILVRVYEELGDHENLVRVLDARLDGIIEPAERRSELLRMARLCEEELGDKKRAFEALGRALAATPGDEEVQRELDRVGAETGELGALVNLYAEQVDEVFDNDLVRELHLKIARMAEERLGDDQRAEEHYRQALDCEGDERLPLEALDAVLVRSGDQEALLEVLERRLVVEVDAPVASELHYRSGLIREELGDADGAFASFRETLQLHSGHEGAREALGRMLDNDVYRVPVLDVLEPISEERGDFSGLASLLEVRLTTVSDGGERANLLEKIAELMEGELGDPAGALEVLLRALAEAPTEERLLEAAERLAGEQEAFERLATRVGELIDGDGSSQDVQRSLGLRVAGWYAEQLGNEEAAVERYRAVVDADPECVDALKALEAAYRRRGDFDALVLVLGERAEVTREDQSRRNLLVEVARIHDEQRDDPGAAIESYQSALEVDPSDDESLDALARLFRRTEAWADLVEVLNSRSEIADEVATKIALKHEIGRVLLEESADRDAAVDVYRSVLDLDPGETSALLALEQIYRERGDHVSVEEVLARRLDVVEGPEAVELLCGLAKLNVEDLDNSSAAVGYLQRALTLEPRNDEVFRQIESLLRKSEQWYDLIEVVRKRSLLKIEEDETEEAVMLLVSIARLWTDELDNPDAAAEVLEEVLQQDEENTVALAELARLYAVTEQWERCSDVLEKAAALSPEPAAAADLAFRKGKVLVHQGAEEALVREQYELALSHAPDHLESAKAIEALARGKGEWARVAEMLEIQATVLEPAEAVVALVELGAIHRGSLANPAGSVAALERARQLAPEDREVLVPLAEAYCDAGRLEDAEPLLTALIEQAGGRRSKELARYHQLLGKVAQQRGDLTAACQQFEKAYRIDSGSGPVMVALGRAYFEAEDWQGARRIYRSMLLQNPRDDWGITRAGIFGQLGRVHAALGETDKARGMLERGLEIDPENQQLLDALNAL